VRGLIRVVHLDLHHTRYLALIDCALTRPPKACNHGVSTGCLAATGDSLLTRRRLQHD
jgi:hypothetical protein